jgi:bifunctional non-homologous end joining protein LigD
MPLEEYRRKRDFELTPEPQGVRPEPRPHHALRFVVQRHRASRLHYDFRLEIGGVLVSWAVPRGPSMRPLSKRHAARTEDHPIEYLDFEGIIPVGEYGAGDVIVWDQGTWQPEGLDDPAASVEDGEVKIVLHGQRLRGRFVLVRTHKRDQVREDWLLIHKKGEESDPFWDIRDYQTSVLSGLTNEQVASRRRPPEETPPARSISDVDLSAAAQGQLPTFITPMLATAIDRPFSDPDWLFELKLDGYRVQAIVEGRAVKLRTRNGKDAATYFPAFAALPSTWLAGYQAVIDGEMVALDADGRPSFSLLQELAGLRGLSVRRGERHPRPRAVPGPAGERRDQDDEPAGQLVFHAFDLLHLDSWDLLDVPLEERKRLLHMVIRDHPSVRYVSHVLEHGEDFQRAIADQGLEGSVAKLRSSRYEPGKRSRTWLKVKARREQELVLVGYEPGQGSHRELGSLLVATHEVEGWRFAGQVGSGMDAPTRKLLRHLLDEHRTDTPPAPGAPRMADPRWSEPRHVIRAEFTEWTPDGLLRQASYKGREIGRDPRTVTREPVERLVRVQERLASDPGPAPEEVESARRERTRIRPGRRRGVVTLELVRDEAGRHAPAEAVTGAELEALAALGRGGRWQVGGHEVALSNLDKVLFPGVDYTKRDLVRYYATIAPAMLPYLRERPLNVHRWPDGVTGRTQFWQKQIPSHAPDWVARWDYPEAGHDQSHTYVVADRVATMAWLANQAVIDMHPWTSRLPEYWRPTYALVDIDPGERTTWPEVLTLARLYRTALQHLGVKGSPKVTGKRGIQIWIHVQPRYTFDETRDWVGELSRGVAAVVPDLISWEWGKADREGRARLDYTQNSIIKTLVAPYAVRPVPTAAVSTPITWDELDDPTLRPDGWDIRSVPERVRERGDLFSGVLGDPQALPPLS